MSGERPYHDVTICDFPSCSTPVTVQLIIIDLLHSLVIVLVVLVISLTLCVQALLIVICHLLNSPPESQ